MPSSNSVCFSGRMVPTRNRYYFLYMNWIAKEKWAIFYWFRFSSNTRHATKFWAYILQLTLQIVQILGIGVGMKTIESMDHRL